MTVYQLHQSASHNTQQVLCLRTSELGLAHKTEQDFMNLEQFQGFWKNLKAPLKEKWEKFTDEDLLEIDGNMMKFKEVIDTRYGERKE